MLFRSAAERGVAAPVVPARLGVFDGRDDPAAGERVEALARVEEAVLDDAEASAHEAQPQALRPPLWRHLASQLARCGAFHLGTRGEVGAAPLTCSKRCTAPFSQPFTVHAPGA